MNDVNSLAHTSWNCKYHVVFRLYRHAWSAGRAGARVSREALNSLYHIY